MSEKLAKPIEPTPVLSGRDAEEFIRVTKQEEREPDANRVAFIEKCRETYRKYKE